MGKYIGMFDKKSKLLAFGLFIGFIISIAEPDLIILAKQISQTIKMDYKLIVIIISMGVGLLISMGLLRIFRSIKLSNFMLIVYSIVFLLMYFTNDFSHSLAFDSSGATTGAMSTPFIIALGLGVSRYRGEDKAEKDSFGLLGIASAGAVIAGLFLNVIAKEENMTLIISDNSNPIILAIKSAIFAMLPIVGIFTYMNKKYFKIEKNMDSLKFGLFYTFVGLIMFLASVDSGFMNIAREMGKNFSDSKFLPIIAFVLGLLVVLAEPAVFVLSDKVEQITGGHIKKKYIARALSIGVATAVLFSVLKLKINYFKLWMLVVPCLLIALFLARRVDDIFVGIAFDAGGVASGPMTATFILSFFQGIGGDIKEGFGVISFVCMVPIVTIMILGSLYNRSKK